MKLLLCLLAPVLLCLQQAVAELKTDIEFAKPGGVSLTLDAFTPEGAGPFPTCILVHGGGFTKGDKTTFIKPLFEPLSKAGFTWFTINYRLAPTYRYPACIDDVQAAIRWVKAHAAEYKVDVKRIALVGESAGGHLVSLAGVIGEGDTSVTAVVPFYAPHDLEFQADHRHTVGSSLTALFGISEDLNEANRQVLREASSYQKLKAGLPPYLLIHGDADATVPYAQSTRFQEKSRSLGNVCDLITVKGGIHGMGGWAKLGSDYAQQMIAWLNKTMPASP
jgi:acetyl esterase/lipase